MATASNTKFKVEHGLDVIGSANVSTTLDVVGAVTVNGAFTVNNTAAVGNTTVTGFISVSSYGTFGGTVNTALLNTGNTTVTGFINASSYGTFGGTVNATSLNIGANVNVSTTQLNIGNATVNTVLTQTGLTLGTSASNTSTSITANTLTVGNTTTGTINAYALNISGISAHIGNTSFKANSSLSSIILLGNNTVSNIAIDVDATSIAGNVAFDIDLLFLDATNNKVSIKNISPSNAAVLTITGNVEFSTSSTGLRLMSSNASMNASIMMVGNTTNSRVTFATYESGTATQDGGFMFVGTNATATQTLLEFNNTVLKYKSGNVATSTNFGVYNVSGTRVGP